MKKLQFSLLFILLIGVLSFPALATDVSRQNPHTYLTTAEQEASVASLINVDDGQLYTMDYTTDYKLDEILEAGVDDIPSLVSFIEQSMLNGANAQASDIHMGCDAFTARTPEDAVLFGRIFDYDEADIAAVLVRTTPKNGYASIALADAGMTGWYGRGSLDDGTTDLSLLVAMPYFIMDGMNEKGLAITALELDYDSTRQNTGKPVITTSVVMRLVLDRAATVDEAIALFKSYDMVSIMPEYDYHFLVADATGRAVVLEYCENELYVLDNTFVTNFYLEPSHDMPADHDNRYPILQAVLNYRENILTPHQAMSLMELVGREKPDKHSVISHWAALYDLTHRTTTVVIRQDFSKQFTFSIDDISGRQP